MNANRRTVLKAVGAGTATPLGGVGAAAAKPPSRGDTIVDVSVAADGFDVLVAAVQEAGLGDVLTYHVVPGRRKANSIVDADSVPTLNGAKVDVDGTDLNGDQADIVTTNIEASNGFIHVIDGVLQP